MMLKFVYSPGFKKEFKRATFQGRDVMKIFPPLIALLNEQPVPSQYRDHPLTGEWTGHREFHLAPDWIVIYRIEFGSLILVRIGSHSDLLKP
jgi:mRNA interferase YafQ